MPKWMVTFNLKILITKMTGWLWDIDQDDTKTDLYKDYPVTNIAAASNNNQIIQKINININLIKY